jgi:hypothetical protein
MSQHTLNSGIIRLAQMHEIAARELQAERVKYNIMVDEMTRVFDFMQEQLDEMRKGIDDIAILTGVIEPTTAILPSCIPTGANETLRMEQL